MRILMLNNEYPPLGGGQGVVNQTLIDYFEKVRDLEIDLVTATRDASTAGIEAAKKNASIYRVPIKNKNIHHSSSLDLITFFWRSLRVSRKLCLNKKYDLVVAFSAVPAGAVAWLLNREFKIPYITRSPGVDIPGFEARYKFLYPILAPIIKGIWRRARTNVASSKVHAELMKKIESKAKIEIIVNAVDQKLFSISEEKKTKRRILCVARLVKRKGVDILIHAFSNIVKRFPDAELHLVGTGDDEENLKVLSRQLGISNQVMFYGFIERSQINKFYREADLFVLPSHNEGMSNAALEALASGLPLILTDVGGSYELVTHGENGFCFPVGDVNKLAEFISESLQDMNKLKRMGQASLARAKNFSWESVSNEYLELMRRCAISEVN